MLLHEWTVAILKSTKDHSSGYKFGLSSDHEQATRELESSLHSITKPTEHTVQVFHKFIKHVLFPPTKRTGRYNKWDNPIERLFALSALQHGGIFKQPLNITQMFAYTSYHIRGAILFEGYKIHENDDFAGDLYR